MDEPGCFPVSSYISAILEQGSLSEEHQWVSQAVCRLRPWRAVRIAGLPWRQVLAPFLILGISSRRVWLPGVRPSGYRPPPTDHPGLSAESWPSRLWDMPLFRVVFSGLKGTSQTAFSCAPPPTWLRDCNPQASLRFLDWGDFSETRRRK